MYSQCGFVVVLEHRNKASNREVLPQLLFPKWNLYFSNLSMERFFYSSEILYFFYHLAILYSPFFPISISIPILAIASVLAIAIVITGTAVAHIYTVDKDSYLMKFAFADKLVN